MPIHFESYSMIPRIPIETVKDKDKLREIVKKQTEEFLAKGGTITKLAHGASGYDIPLEWDRTFIRGKNDE